MISIERAPWRARARRLVGVGTCGVIAWLLAPAGAVGQDVELRVGHVEFLRSDHLQPGTAFHLSTGDGSRSGFGLRLGVSAKLGPKEAEDCAGMDPLECGRDGTTVDTAGLHLEPRYWVRSGGPDARFRAFVGGRLGYERMFNGWNIGGAAIGTTGGVEIGLGPTVALQITGAFGYVTYQPPVPVARLDFDGFRATLDAGVRFNRPRRRG